MISFLKQAALVLILAVVFGSSLALMYSQTDPVYKQNQDKAIMESILATIPGAQDAQDPQTVKVELADGRQVYQVLDGRQLLGWAYVAKGKGFGGDIKLLIGLDPSAKGLVGIDVLEDVETPGFGHSINEEKVWKSKFRPRAGRPLPLDRPLVVVKGQPKAGNPYQIQAITGATISSKAVISIINDTAPGTSRELAERTDKDG